MITFEIFFVDYTKMSFFRIKFFFDQKFNFRIFQTLKNSKIEKFWNWKKSKIEYLKLEFFDFRIFRCSNFSIFEFFDVRISILDFSKIEKFENLIFRFMNFPIFEFFDFRFFRFSNYSKIEKIEKRKIIKSKKSKIEKCENLIFRFSNF